MLPVWRDRDQQAQQAAWPFTWGPTWLTAPAYLQKQALKSLRSLGLADDILAAALAEHTSTASRSAFLLIWYPSKGGKDTQFCSWPNETWSQLSGSYC